MNVSRSGSALLEEWIVQSSETWKSQLSVILGWRNGNYQMYDLLVKQEGTSSVVFSNSGSQ